VSWSTFGINGQRKYLTRSEADRFLSTAKQGTLQIYVFCWFLAATGCRISEALSVTAKSIDFEAGLVILESLKKRQKNVYRAIPLPVTLLDSLAELIAQTELDDAARLWPWSRMTGYRRITEVMRKADIAGSWASPKGLRHGFGVRAVQSGAPLHLVQRWLGHADMKTTAIYASAMGPEERDIASRTWLKQDCEEADGGAETQSLGRGASKGPVETRSDPDCSLVTESAPQENLKNPWTKRFFSKAETIVSCQVIQFYLFFHKIFH
jgi:integrase